MAENDQVEEYAKACIEYDELKAEIARLKSAVSWQETTITARDARIAELEEALESLVDEILRSRRGFCGDHFVYTPQINERSVEKVRAALGKDASPSGGVEMVAGEEIRRGGDRG